MADNVREFVVNSLQQIYEKIRKEDFILVEGTSSAAGSSSSPYLATRWEASIPGITEVFDGLKIAYRIRTNTGVSTGGVVLSIDEENYYPVVLNANTKITTHYPIGSTILLIFNSTQTVSDVYLTSGTKTTVTGCWQIADYNNLNSTNSILEIIEEDEEVISTAVNELNSYVHSSYAYILQTIEDNEFVIASTLTEHDERLIDVENALENVNYEETDPTVPNYIKNITQSNINTWNTVSNCVTKTQLTNQSYVTSSTLNTRLSNSSYAGYSYVYAAYSYIIDSMVSNERIIAAGFANHESRITTLEATGGEDNVQSNWNETDSTSDAYILNKPEIPSIAGLATESYVLDKISGLVNSAPGTLDTLNELAAALGNDPAFATTVSTQIGERVTKTELSNQSYVTETSLQSRGYLTSFTETDPVFTASPAHSITSTDITNWNNKVSNVQANWNTTNSSDQSYILNKPELVWEKGDGANSAVLSSATNFEKNYANGDQSVAQGHHTSAYGNYSHAEGVNTFAGRNIILNEIWDAQGGDGNHAEGLNTVAWGGGSHAEGDQTYTKGYASHAEGLYSYAYGQSSHTEGYQTVSYAAFSHAEGRGSYSAGHYSHAEGNYTNTYNTYEHAEGVANVSIKNSDTFGDSENTQFSIGIGEVKYPNNNEAYPPNVINRKNAFTIMQNGNAYFLNVGNYNGTNLTSAKPLHTVISDLSSSIPAAVTESTVSGWGFTKNAAANDATITIAKGSYTGTFTTNASTAKTINLPNELPSYSSADSGKILSVNSSGQLVWITPVSIYTGSGEPSNSTGNDGDIYLQS